MSKMSKKIFFSITKKLHDPKFVKTFPLDLLNAILIIRKDYGKKELTTRLVAEKIRTSESHFCDIFHDFLGIHFIEFLHHYRIEKSKPLLLIRNLLIKEVALKVGCGNAKYFSRIFHNFEKMTPSEYRRKSGVKKHSK